MLFKKLLLGTMAAGAIAAAAPASADVIFSDNFNRANSNTVGSPWSELENDSNDVAISSNQLLLRDELSGNPDAAAAAGTFSTTGFTNITLSLGWNDQNAESGDVLHIGWAVGSPSLSDEGDWTNLATVNGNGSDTYTLVGAGNLAAISIILWIDVSSSNEGYLIDNVVLSGDQIEEEPPPPQASIAEPGTLALIGLSLLALGARRRKRSA